LRNFFGWIGSRYADHLRHNACADEGYPNDEKEYTVANLHLINPF
jgi:hypothetical protein